MDDDIERVSDIGKALGKALQALRTKFDGPHRGGRPKILRPCPRCAREFGTVELRAHLRECRESSRTRSLPARDAFEKIEGQSEN